MGVGAALLLIAVVFSASLNALHAEALRAELYDEDSRVAVAVMHGGDPIRDAAAVEAYIGMDAEEQHRFAETVASYMRGTSDELPVQLNEKERIHFADVRRLIQLAGRVSSIFLGFAVLLTVFGAWLAEHPGVRAGRAMAIGTATGVVLLSAAGFWTGRNFSTAFYWLHDLVFTNDLWLMDSRTDICIRVMPMELFEIAAVHCLKRALWQIVLIVFLLVLLTIFMRRLIKKWVNGPIPG